MAQENTIVALMVDNRQRALDLLTRLEQIDREEDDIRIREAAFAHKISEGHIKLEQFNDLGGGRGAFGGGTIGIVAGTVVAGPLGAAIGGVIGAAAAGLYTRLRDSGISNDFMNEVGAQLEPGKTALFIIYSGTISDELRARLQITQQDFGATLLYTSLSDTAIEAVTTAYEETGEEIVGDIDVYTEAATDADAEATDADIAPLAEQAEQAAPLASDNLTLIDGIGPKISEALTAAGITTYDQLYRASEAQLREALQAARMPTPSSLITWPRQAKLAADGDWKGLYNYNAKRKLDSAKGK
jgi:uncharacterized membrane protein